MFDRDSRIIKKVARDNLCFKEGSFSYNPASVAAGATGVGTVTITGLKTTDLIFLIPPNLAAGLVYAGHRISANNTLEIRLANVTGVAIDDTAKTWRYFAIRFGKWYE